MNIHDTEIWHRIATVNGCKFMGIQKTMTGSMPIFHVPVAEGEAMFCIHDGETIEMAADRVRRKFKEVAA